MNKEQRKNNLLPNGKPRWIRIYDNGGLNNPKGTIDRYTVIFTHAQSFRLKNYKLFNGWFPVLAMSEHPSHPQGFVLHLEYAEPIDRPKYSHLGKRIEFDDLPDDCRKLVIDNYCDYWNLRTVTGKIYKVKNNWYEYILKDHTGKIWDSKIETYNGVQRLAKQHASDALRDALDECNLNGNKVDFGF